MPTEEEIRECFKRDWEVCKKNRYPFVIGFEQLLWLAGYARGLQTAKEVYAGLKEEINAKV